MENTTLAKSVSTCVTDAYFSTFGHQSYTIARTMQTTSFES